MPRALLSVHDKTGLIELAQRLVALGWDLVASGGTERALRDAGMPVVSVEQVTGVPEILGGRVKTLHPAIHGGILARDREADLDDLRRLNYAPINLIVCNLYPFQETVANPATSLQDAIEQIDIGGVTLLRAAAKNFLHTVVVCDPADYGQIASAFETDGTVDLAVRRGLAIKSFALTRDYDTAIHAFLAEDVATKQLSDELPEHLSIGMQRVEVLRYGENPHQVAGYYSRKQTDALGGTILGGKHLSYNNILDLDAAWRAVSGFALPTVVIVKHLNPIGVASATILAEAYPLALAADPVSAFGGVIAVNRPVDEAFVMALGTLFLEAIAAPSFTLEAQTRLNEGRKNCRLLQIPASYDGIDLEFRSVHRGILVQRVDRGDPERSDFRTVTARAPNTNEVEALKYAWNIVQHVKSNGIVIAVPNASVGIGGDYRVASMPHASRY